jgi:hypothetical protein
LSAGAHPRHKTVKAVLHALWVQFMVVVAKETAA